MADPVAWPVTFPQSPLNDGLQNDPGYNSIDFETASGRTRKRLRATTTPRRIQAVFDFKGSQVADWYDFYTNDLKQGAIPFVLDDPLSGVSMIWTLRDAPTERIIKHDYLRVTLSAELTVAP